MESLPDIFHKNIGIAISEEGVYPHQMLVRNAVGELKFWSLAVSPEMVMLAIVAQWRMDRTSEIVFALDRTTREGQGTTLGDVLTGAWWNGKEWKPFIIEYQHEPRIVKPIRWDNAHWNERIVLDLAHFGMIES